MVYRMAQLPMTTVRLKIIFGEPM